MKKILVFLFLIFAGGYFLFILPSTKNPEPQLFVVGLKDSQQEVINKLYQQGFIKKPWIFEWILMLSCYQKKNCLLANIAPGGYYLAKNQNAFKLAASILSGPEMLWINLPPGKRKEQLGLIIQKEFGWSNEKTYKFIEMAEEGYLFPETYLLNPNDKVDKIIAKIKNTFNENFSAEIQKKLLNLNIRNDTAIKIASLIERESGSSFDKPLIAGIILNRIQKNMRLEIDATVQYALANQNCRFSTSSKNPVPLSECDFWPRIKSGQTRMIKSEYNTYINNGLPPGPICSPSLESILAVANPADTKALFYLHSWDKQIHTAETYEEHLENIKKYLN